MYCLDIWQYFKLMKKKKKKKSSNISALPCRVAGGVLFFRRLTQTPLADHSNNEILVSFLNIEELVDYIRSYLFNIIPREKMR